MSSELEIQHPIIMPCSHSCGRGFASLHFHWFFCCFFFGCNLCNFGSLQPPSFNVWLIIKIVKCTYITSDIYVNKFNENNLNGYKKISNQIKTKQIKSNYRKLQMDVIKEYTFKRGPHLVYSLMLSEAVQKIMERILVNLIS